jgi:crotonobetainyl-CoA:carnitine CoA-transferase CaiB-like acyl-CoA transferase
MLKVVEFASVLAGPAVGMFFAELGAEVIKIENPTTGGDVTRGWKLPNESPDINRSAYFYSVNWGKKHLFLNLNVPDDLQQATQLALAADIVVANFKPSFAQKMGLDPDTLHRQNPRLIYAQVNSFADPTDESPAFDIVLQAEAGFLYMSGEPDREPVRMPVALIDLMTAHQLKEGILLALWNRERTGKGCYVSASLLESALASLANQASNWLNAGHVPQRMGTLHPNIAPYGEIVTCADGLQVLLAVGTEKQFAQLCKVLQRPEWLKDRRFAVNQDRVKHRSTLIAMIREIVEQRTFAVFYEQCREAGVPVAQIRDMPAVFELPAAQAMILEEKTPDGTISKRLKTKAFTITDGV